MEEKLMVLTSKWLIEPTSMNAKVISRFAAGIQCVYESISGRSYPITTHHKFFLAIKEGKQKILLIS